KEAGSLYKQVANAQFTQQNFLMAEIWYELEQKCARLSGSQFDPYEALNLARCYQWAGKQLRGRSLCQRLLSKEAVRRNPELLSAIYARLATAHSKTSAEDRVRLARLAVECLPPGSPKMCFRHLTLASRLLAIGDLDGAKQILETAKTYVLSDK